MTQKEYFHLVITQNNTLLTLLRREREFINKQIEIKEKELAATESTIIKIEKKVDNTDNVMEDPLDMYELFLLQDRYAHENKQLTILREDYKLVNMSIDYSIKMISTTTDIVNDLKQ